MSKIVIIGTAFPFRGGLAVYNERLALAFQNQGHEVVIYTFTLQYPNFLFPGKSQYSEEPRPEHLTIRQEINSVNPFNWRKVAKKITGESPDLVIVKFWLPFMEPCFGTILRGVKKRCQTKVISIIDNIIPHEKRIGDRAFTKYFVKPLDGFVAMSKNVLEDINQFDDKKPKVFSPHPIYDNFGVIEEKKEALKKLGLNSDVQYALFFGLIRDYKGLDILLEAFACDEVRNLNVKLIIAGEYYSDKDKYKQLIRKFKLEEKVIEVDKFIPDSEVANFFNACDLVVQPYKSATQSGVTQIAYHFNKPMVVTNVGGLTEMCPDEKVGYVVDPNPLAVAKGVERFFKEADINKMTAGIIEEKRKYSWEILTKSIFSLVDKFE